MAQAGAQLTITGSISIVDETTALEAVPGTVNETGFVTFPPDSLVNAVPPWRRHLRHPHTGYHDAEFLGQHGALSQSREHRRLRDG